MYPYLLEGWIGQSVLIPTYGVLLATGFTVAYIESLRRAIRRRKDPKHIERLFLLIVVGSLLGARAFHVLIEEFAFYRTNPRQVFAIWEGGFTLYGGIAVALSVIALYTRWKELPYLATLDLLTPAVILGMSVGRLGCLAAGCCWGGPTSLPWAITYTHRHAMTNLRGIPLHPAQLYESLGVFLIFLALTRFEKKASRPGAVFFAGIGGYAVVRFFVEFARADASRGFVGPFSFGQILSMGILALTVAWFLRNRWLPARA